jgi:hypothetical protein
MKPAYRTIALATLLTTLWQSGCGQATTDNATVQETTNAVAESAPLARSSSPPGARVFFVTPADGDNLSNPVRVEFGIEGMTVARAGTQQPNSGHHHLLINTGLPNLAMPIPADENYRHFGDGSTSTEITLEPGRHTLRLLLGNHLHIPHDPPVTSEVITITVE